MKKNYFMLAATTMMLAACSQSDLVNEIKESAPQAIEFSTFTNKATRAVENNKDAGYSGALNEHHTTFKVWASKQITDNTVIPSTTKYLAVYNGSTVTYGNAWVASPLKFWDKTATSYEFYAAAPATITDGVEWGATNTVGNSGTLSLTGFSLTGVNNTTSESWKDLADKDLMIAAPCSIPNASYNTAQPATVDLNFIHILSRLNIKVKSTYNDGDNDDSNDPVIMLTGLNVCGLKNKGDFNEATAAVAAGTTSRWTNLDGTYTLSAELPTGKLTSTAVTTHKYLIIPQAQKNVSGSNNVASAPSNEAYIQIQYTVDREPYETYYSLAHAFDISSGSDLKFNEGWQNTLTIDIVPNVIRFTGTVATWGNEVEDSVLVK